VGERVKRAFKYRFYPTSEQAEHLNRTFGCVRLVYNKALNARATAYTTEHRSVSYGATSAMLTVSGAVRVAVTSRPSAVGVTPRAPEPAGPGNVRDDGGPLVGLGLGVGDAGGTGDPAGGSDGLGVGMADGAVVGLADASGLSLAAGDAVPGEGDVEVEGEGEALGAALAGAAEPDGTGDGGIEGAGDGGIEGAGDSSGGVEVGLGLPALAAVPYPGARSFRE